MPIEHGTTARLLSPYPMRDLTLPNRVVLAPMTRARAGADRIPNEMMGTYYAQRASAGLLITEATTISPAANGWVASPGIYTEAMVQGWARVVRAIHDAGGRVFLQLWHCGRASHSDFHDGDPPPAPSAVRLNGDKIHTPEGKKDYETPRAMDAGEVRQTIDDYGVAAAAAARAGFDGVEVHAPNGYLIDTFLQSKTNRRDDEYGGDVSRRCKFLFDVVDRVCGEFPSNRVGVRLSPNGAFNDMGSPDYRPQFLAAAEGLNDRSLAYLHVLDGLAFGFHELGEPMTLEEFRRVFNGPLMANCGYDQTDAERAIERGDADMVSFGRPYIANPDLVQRYATGRDLEPDYPQRYWYGGGEEGYVYPPADIEDSADTESSDDAASD